MKTIPMQRAYFGSCIKYFVSNTSLVQIETRQPTTTNFHDPPPHLESDVHAMRKTVVRECSEK